ncbi:integral type I protein, variant [Capsaspora owczarzaki ATCC 30864]|uniref:Integral type I protein, variant n=1 Tax=Capsaspora owczarzaki (strain ATCC 30864) TaxID=595528 RepID=A0A0D2VPR3_CAPO3|nr:integral type I protein, variant [Capsaspora owczarzaki ATCC 30864]
MQRGPIIIQHTHTYTHNRAKVTSFSSKPVLVFDCLSPVQVITGGNLDIDVAVVDPNNVEVFRRDRSTLDGFEMVPKTSGTFSICFSNEFSTFTHKTVFFDVKIGDQAVAENELPAHTTVMTKMEMDVHSTHQNLDRVIAFQLHHRIEEATDRDLAEGLNTRVFVWSLLQALVMIGVGVGQVVLVRRLFQSDKAGPSLYGQRRPI